MTGTTDYRRENSPRGIVSSETSFAHSRPIVNDKSGNIIVTHFVEK
jgi:hypothetical protein